MNRIVNKIIIFSGAGSIDNDSQNGGYTPKWEWSLSVDNSIWQTMGTTTSILYNYVFTTADTFYIRVRFCDDDNQWGAYYTFTIEIIDCKRYYYVKDHLGNIRQTVDENGVIISAQDYSPYACPDAKQIGREVIRSYNNADANDKYKFTEKERDKETNLDYFGARYYDPTIGRWNSIDRFADIYPGLSPYNYTGCNPVRFIDINGDSVAFHDEDAEKHHNSMYGQNSVYTKQYDKLHSSKVWYHVYDKDVASKITSGQISQGGVFTTDGKSIIVAIDMKGGDNETRGNIIHEFQHGVQFEEGKIQFSNENGTWMAHTSKENEVDAFQTQFDAGYPAKDWTSNTIGWNYVNKLGTYNNLPTNTTMFTHNYTEERILKDATNTGGKAFGWSIYKSER